MSSSRRAPLPGWVRAVQTVSRLGGIAAALLILASVFVICQMVFVRAVLGESSIWQTEFVIFSLVAATFIGAPYIMLTHGHVGVDVLPAMVDARARRRLHLIGSLISLAFCAPFLWGSLPWWLEAFQSEQRTPSIWNARLWIPYLSVPVGLALLCLQIAAEVRLVHGGLVEPFGDPTAGHS